MNAHQPDRALIDQAFTRAAGAELVSGNSVRLLKDATENYPAWLDAIHNARRKIYFENYFIRDDEVGAEFAIPLSILLAWIAIALLMRAHRLRQMRRSQGLPTTRLARRSGDCPP